MLQIPVCSNESSSQEVALKGLMGLQCSCGDGSFSIKVFLAAATPCILLLAVFVPGTGASV